MLWLLVLQNYLMFNKCVLEPYLDTAGQACFYKQRKTSLFRGFRETEWSPVLTATRGISELSWEIFLARNFLFIRNLMSNYNKNGIAYVFIRMLYLIGVFWSVIFSFWRDSWWNFFATYDLMYCRCKNWRGTQSLCLSIQSNTSLKVSSNYELFF
jgi:hypothetical protein